MRLPAGPALVVLSGLPGVGKSTIARAMLAIWPAAVYLRIDTIEQALRDSGALAGGDGGDVGAAGYAVAVALARTHLTQGQPVLADCVNPLPVTRDAWHGVARAAQVPWLDVEVVCSDIEEHRRRVETRRTDVAGLVPPRWDAVQAHDYTPWEADDVGGGGHTRQVVDTAHHSAQQAATTILAALRLRKAQMQ